MGGLADEYHVVFLKGMSGLAFKYDEDKITFLRDLANEVRDYDVFANVPSLHSLQLQWTANGDRESDCSRVKIRTPATPRTRVTHMYPLSFHGLGRHSKRIYQHHNFFENGA
ncbi:unnamed protein product [Toxocara canis]|uniref:Uncharacterized protein n=1 Tax=Toxocara canis TaxID=6265 RepID=A0A183UMU1_TOXCA|nr:unnamed protein product [Toxocara canis]